MAGGGRSPIAFGFCSGYSMDPVAGGYRDFWYTTLAGAFRCRRLLLSSVPCSAIGFLMRSLSRSIRQSRSRWESQVWTGHFQEEGSHAGG